MLKRNEKIIRSKFLQYLFPGIMLTMALQLGNIVDAMIVGNVLGADAMSAVQIGMTADNIIEIPGYVLGVGGSVAAGILLGKRNREEANRVFSVTLTVSVLCGLLATVLSFTAPHVATVLTGGGALQKDVQDFVFYTFLCAPILSLALQFMNYVAVDNCPNLASAYVIVANVINLTCDYVLLKFTPIGTGGAALSTAIGYGAALLLLIGYYKSPKRMLHLVNPFRGFGRAFGFACKIGIPTLLYMIFIILKDYSLNLIVVTFIGTFAMAVYTVCCNIVLLSQLLVGGIIGTLSSIGDVIYGEKDYYGIRVLCKNIMAYAGVVVALLLVVLTLFPGVVLALFGMNDGAAMAAGQKAVRIFVTCLPFYVINKFFTTYYQVTEKTFLSGLITSFQNCVVILPTAFLFVASSRASGRDPLNLLMLSFVVSELLTMVLSQGYRLLRYRGQGLLLIPREGEEKVLDLSLSPRLQEVPMLVDDILAFCENVTEASRANLIAVVAEEMTANIIKHGGRGVESIDVNLSVSDDKLILRTRDNGIPFDPTEYTYDHREEYSISGIEVVKKIADRIQYIRILNLNNTVVELKR